MYPIYATCVDLGIPIFVCAGIPGPRIPFAPQEVSRIDVAMFDFPTYFRGRNPHGVDLNSLLGELESIRPAYRDHDA